MIYFLRRPEGGPIKIGTTVCLSRRLKELAAEHGCTFEVLAVVDGSRPEERELHQRFSGLRVVNEWFEPGDDLLGFIVSDGREWDGADEVEVLAVKLDAEVARDAKIVAAFKGLSLTQYLSDAMRPLVARDLDDEYTRRTKGKPPKGGE